MTKELFIAQNQVIEKLFIAKCLLLVPSCGGLCGSLKFIEELRFFTGDSFLIISLPEEISVLELTFLTCLAVFVLVSLNLRPYVFTSCDFS